MNKKNSSVGSIKQPTSQKPHGASSRELPATTLVSRRGELLASCLVQRQKIYRLIYGKPQGVGNSEVRLVATPLRVVCPMGSVGRPGNRHTATT